MRPMKTACLAVIAISLAACTTAPPIAKADPAAEAQVLQRVNTLLSRYSSNDQPGVVAMLDPRKLSVFGSNLSEVIHSSDEMRSFMSRDFAQWGGAKFSDVRNTDVRVDGNLATAYFVITFSAANGPTLPIRLCTTWHRVKGEWLLTQSASAVMQ